MLIHCLIQDIIDSTDTGERKPQNKNTKKEKIRIRIRLTEKPAPSEKVILYRLSILLKEL